MEEQLYTQSLLDRVPCPGFCVKENTVTRVNSAAAGLALRPGDPLLPMLEDSAEDYALLDGQMYLVLTVAGQPVQATVIRSGEEDLFLLEQEESMEEFCSMALVSGQLRMPLNSVISSTEALLALQPEDDPESSRYAGQIRRGLMQLMRLVCNLSDAERYAGLSSPELRDVDAFLRELFEKASAHIPGNITLTYSGLAEPVYSLIDPEQVERAVWNLLSNSLKFLSGQGHIQATLSRHGARLRLTLQDSGSGIAEAVRGDLFRRYLRHPAIEDSRYGLGLGMVLVRSVAANHGGTVLVSNVPDGGTRVTLTLAIRQKTDSILRSPLSLPDYSGGWDHCLLELSGCLPPESYRNI